MSLLPRVSERTETRQMKAKVSSEADEVISNGIEGRLRRVSTCNTVQCLPDGEISENQHGFLPVHAHIVEWS